MKEDFKNWADANLAWDEQKGQWIGDDIALSAWQARQPEIDTLKEVIRNRQDEVFKLSSERLTLKAENERLRNALPLTPEAVIAFIGRNFDSMEPVDEEGKPQGHLDCVRYSLTVHDLLSAFSDMDFAMKEAD